jgi:hypothetical protein
VALEPETDDAEQSFLPDTVDPKGVVPDIDEPCYYSEVDRALFHVYEPKIYEPVVEKEELPPPQDTIAYTVTITSCPGTYAPAESEVTDPGPDTIYEATAVVKETVCSATETALAARKLKASNGENSRNLVDEIATATETDGFVM